MPQQLTVVPIPCLRDNYAYLAFDPQGDGSCFVVDASEAAPVRRELDRRGLTLRTILTTHHHPDHVGGNLELGGGGPVEVIGHESERERIPGLSRGVSHGEKLDVCGVEFSVLHVPGHTQGGVVFFTGEIAFTGDTLFCGGCGRLKEGTAQQLHNSLTDVMSVLSDDMLIYCGHEYTLSNLAFARSIFSCRELESRYEDVERKRVRGEYCASATLRLERATNPFLLCHRREIQEAMGQDDEVEAFAELRRRKDPA